jgi:hypothetical protein
MDNTSIELNLFIGVRLIVQIDFSPLKTDNLF